MSSSTFNDGATVSGERPLLAGRYRVVRQLGQGGMGSVWLAEDTTLDNRQVALKMLPTILVANKRAYNQLKSEALVSLKLSHPNIAALRSFENNDGNPFLVMDYIDGETLDDHLAEKGKLTPEETRRLLAPIAAALDYAHSCGVVHRDIKPGNVMIARNGTPCILDFGIAREIEETMTRVTGRNSSGTLMYMSPEQLHGAASAPAQDVYSFAAMVYECLNGAPPFSRGQIECQIEHDYPAPLEGAGVLGRSVLQGLAKDPAARPATCAAVLEGNCAAAPQPSSSAPPALPTPPTKPKSRILASVLVGYVLGGVMLVLVLGGAHVWREYEVARLQVEKDNDDRLAREMALVADAIAAFERKDWKRGYEIAKQTDYTNADIQFYLGKCFYNGYVVQKDLTEAARWYRKAAEQGNAKAQHNLGACYHYGEGVPKDLTEAVKWCRMAVDQGSARAQTMLGACYANGYGVPKNPTEAVKWFRKAAEQGEDSAQHNLGVCYQYGRGVPQDYVEAVKWYRKAAEQGNAEAQNNLGACYTNGYDVPKDNAEAVKWYRKAAEQGDAMAQKNLGVCYENAQGVPEDIDEAVKWYRKAAAQGNELAKKNLERLNR